MGARTQCTVSVGHEVIQPGEFDRILYSYTIILYEDDLDPR